MTPDALRMNRFTLHFAGADAEAAFAAEQARKAVRPVRIALVVLCGLLLTFYVLTIHVFPGVFVGIGASASQRYSVVASAILAGVYALTYRPVFLRHQQLVMGILAGLLWIGTVRSSVQLPFAVIEARGYTMPLMFTFFVYSVFRLRIVAATLCGWFGAVYYLGYLLGLELASATGTGRSALLLAAANLGGMLICWQMEVAARREFVAMCLLEEERGRAERLLLNILPEPIAARLKRSGESIAEHSDGVTVLFADIAGFTPLSSSKSPQELVGLLNRVFTEFDALADAYGLEKIKTIGDAYMAVAGLPQPQADHAQRAARMALAMQQAIARVAADTGEPLALRVGLHSGPVVAGVIGRRKFAYDLWGDTVNTASRMESHGVPGAIHCTETTGSLLRGAFRLEPRGAMEIKGKGEMNTFLLFAAEGEQVPEAAAS
jgi:class 3 adenylate cyclase